MEAFCKVLFKRIPKNKGVPFEMRRLLPLYPPSPTPSIMTTMKSHINISYPNSTIIQPSPPFFPSLPFRLLLSSPFSSTWGSSQVVHVFWFYDEMSHPIDVTIAAILTGLKANNMNKPELKVTIFTKDEKTLKEMLKNGGDFGEKISIIVAEQPKFRGKKAVGNAMRSAVLKLRKEAEEAKKKVQVFMVISDPDFEFKGCMKHLGKENLVLLLTDGDMASKKGIIEESHHYWMWGALTSGEDVEGRPNER